MFSTVESTAVPGANDVLSLPIGVLPSYLIPDCATCA